VTRRTFYAAIWLLVLAEILVYLGPFVLLSAIRSFCGVVLKRWGLNGILALSAAALLAGGVAHSRRARLRTHPAGDAVTPKRASLNRMPDSSGTPAGSSGGRRSRPAG
jgi:hypothetical protein